MTTAYSTSTTLFTCARPPNILTDEPAAWEEGDRLFDQLDIVPPADGSILNGGLA
jgi:hypothetical protein